MNLVLFIMIGVGLLSLGVAATCVAAALRPPYKHMDKTVTDPILVGGWHLPRK